MGGKISAENVRINLLMSSGLKSKIQYFGKNSNRSANAVVLNILEGAIQKKDDREYDFTADPEEAQRKTARMNLVVPLALKDQLQKEAADHGRSLNNYICSKLMIFFGDIWPDSL